MMDAISHHIQIAADKLPGKKSGCCCRPALVANAMGWEPHGWICCVERRRTAFSPSARPRRTIRGFEAMLWLRKDFGFASAWTVFE